MTINPSAFVLTVHEEHRRSNFHAQADRDRLARLAQGDGDRGPHWPDVAAVLAVVMVLALLFVAGPALADVEPGREQASPMEASALSMTQVVDEHLLDPGAAQTIIATWL